jgi:hypothetical protein
MPLPGHPQLHTQLGNSQIRNCLAQLSQLMSQAKPIWSMSHFFGLAQLMVTWLIGLAILSQAVGNTMNVKFSCENTVMLDVSDKVSCEVTRLV